MKIDFEKAAKKAPMPPKWILFTGVFVVIASVYNTVVTLKNGESFPWIGLILMIVGAYDILEGLDAVKREKLAKKILQDQEERKAKQSGEKE